MKTIKCWTVEIQLEHGFSIDSHYSNMQAANESCDYGNEHKLLAYGGRVRSEEIVIFDSIAERFPKSDRASAISGVGEIDGSRKTRFRAT